MTVQGYILAVDEEYLGSETTVDHPAGALGLFLETATDFNGEGGTAKVLLADDTETTIVYSSVDTGEGILYLASPSTVAIPAGSEVRVAPESLFKVARVVTEEDTEPLPCMVAHALQPVAALAVGARIPGTGETVVCDYIAGEWVVIDVLNRSTGVTVESLDGSIGQITDGQPPATAPQVTVTPVLGGLHMSWDEIENDDLVTYDIYASASAPVLTDTTVHLRGSTVATEYVLLELDGVDLSVTAPTYVKVVARDRDGSGPASLQVSGVPRKITADDLSNGAVTPASMSPTALVPNRVVNGTFGDLTDTGFAVGWAPEITSAGNTADIDVGGGVVGPNALRLTVASGGIVRVDQLPEARFPVSNGVGRSLLVGAAVRASVAVAAGFTLRVYWFDVSGVPLATPTFTNVPNVNDAGVSTTLTRLEGQVFVPAGAAYAGVAVQYAAFAGGAATVRVEVVAVEHVITTNHLVANVVTADKLAVNAVTAAKISATALDGKVITGPLIRTAAAGQRLEFNTVGLQSFNGAGDVTAALAASSGGLFLGGNLTLPVEGTKVIVGAADAARVELGAYTDDFGFLRIMDAPGTRRAEIGMQGASPTFQSFGSALTLDAGGQLNLRSRPGGDVVIAAGTSTSAGPANDIDLLARWVLAWGVHDYQSGTGNSRQVWVNSTTGRLHTPTSARRMKRDITPLEVNPADVYALEAVTFRAKVDVDEWESGSGGTPEPDCEPGLIADDLVGTSLEPFVQFVAGEPTGIHYDRLFAALIPLLRNLNDRVVELESA